MLYDSELGDFTIALLGDVMPTRRLAVFREPRYLRLREIITSADAGFANLETCVHQYFDTFALWRLCRNLSEPHTCHSERSEESA